MSPRIRARTLALLAALACPAAAAGAQTPLPPLALRTARYEIHAGDSASLRAAQADVEFALARFRQLLGDEPAPLAVVVFDSAGGSVSVDDRAFRARGFRTLAWMSDAALRRLRGTNGGREERALSHEACHAWLEAWIDARQGRADDGASRLRASYGHPDAPDWFDEAIAVLCEPDAQRAARVASLPRDGAAPIPLRELLAMRHPRHEMRAGDGDAPGRALATPEALARARMVGPDGQPLPPEEEARLRQALASEGQGGLVLRPSDGGARPEAQLPAGMVRTEMRRADAMDPAQLRRALAFYAEAASVADFLLARGGPRALRTMAEAFARRETSPQALARVGGVPHEADALERAWTAARRDGR